MKLTEHFTLGEMIKTSVKTKDGNMPSLAQIENLKRVCSWLEELRDRKNRAHPRPLPQGGEKTSFIPNPSPQEKGDNDEALYINSGYRSPAVNRAVGGADNSNHLTGCAADIRVLGMEQLLRYAVILLDISDESDEDFDELILERNSKGTYWLHFAVRAPEQGNRRKIRLMQV